MYIFLNPKSCSSTCNKNQKGDIWPISQKTALLKILLEDKDPFYVVGPYKKGFEWVNVLISCNTQFYTLCCAEVTTILHFGFDVYFIHFYKSDKKLYGCIIIKSG